MSKGYYTDRQRLSHCWLRILSGAALTSWRQSLQTCNAGVLVVCGAGGCSGAGACIVPEDCQGAADGGQVLRPGLHRHCPAQVTPSRALKQSVQHLTCACPLLAADIWPHAHSCICRTTIAHPKAVFKGCNVAFRRLKGVPLSVHAKGTAKLGILATLSTRLCRLTLRLQFMRWRELCKQRLVPCVPAPLVRCAALWRAGRRQSGGQVAPHSPEDLRPGLSADHQQVPGKQQTDSAPVDSFEEGSHEQQPGSGALLYHGGDVLPLAARVAQHSKYDGGEDTVDESGTGDHWAHSDYTATEQARTWSHRKAD